MLTEEGRRRNLTGDELFATWLEAMDLGRITVELTQQTVRHYQLNYENDICGFLGPCDCGLVDRDDIESTTESILSD